MKIKGKLYVSLGVLVAMVLAMVVISSYFLYQLSSDTRNILKANYNSLEYCRNMELALNQGLDNPDNVKLFRDNLWKQEKNITEPGEARITELLKIDFENIGKSISPEKLLVQARKGISDIMLLNMEAIKRKTSATQTSNGNAVFVVSLVGVICVLISFTLLVNLPGNIANPISELTQSIKEIARENYDKRLHFEGKNEFGELAKAFNAMAMKLDSYRTANLEKLLEEKTRIETLINNMADPVIGLNEGFGLIFMNDAASQVTGLTREKVIGKNVQDIAISNDLVRVLVRDLFELQTAKPPVKTAPIKIYADGKESYFERELIPISIEDAKGATQLIGHVILLKNITPFKELDFAKTNFIATVSHELKTPLSAIQMSVNLLHNKKVGELNAEQNNLISGIGEDASRLLKITSELLNVTQLESGLMQLNIGSSDAREIMNYAILANKTAAEQKAIRMKVDVSGELKVKSDSEKMICVLSNLISNAIRYSYDNSEVELKVEPRGDMVAFLVTDYGQGIAPQYVPRIFDRYFRVPGSKKEGTGLGLSISKELVEAQGGKIELQTDFGSGSTFTVLLPVV